jgi:hypothetical protein
MPFRLAIRFPVSKQKQIVREISQSPQTEMMRVFRGHSAELPLHLLQRSRRPMLKPARHSLLRRNRQQEKSK